MSTWHEALDGTFTRRIGENETFIKLVSDPGHSLGREHWAINSTATLAPGNGVTKSALGLRLRLAWGHLRFQHPSLAAHVTTDNQSLIYEVPDAESLENWINDTFAIEETKENSAEVIKSLEPTPSARLIYVSKSNEILGHTAHWRTDGIGVLILLNDLLKFATQTSLQDPRNLPWGEESARLAPPIEDAASIPLDAEEDHLKLGEHYVQTFALAGGAVGIPYIGDASTLPGGTCTASERLSKELTQKVVRTCNSLNISVTSAVHASVAFANWKLAASDRKKDHYTSTVRFSLRPYLPLPYSGPEYAAGLYTTGWMEKVSPSNTWQELAEHYNGIYRAGLSEDYIRAHRAYAAGLGDLLRNLPPGLPIPSDVDISSVGIAEELIQRSYSSEVLPVDVTSVSVGVEILTRQAVTFVWTFQEQLNLGVVYNENFHTESQMQEFAKEVRAALLEGLE